MNAFENNGRAISGNNTKTELRFRARAVSRGVAIGRIVCLHGTNRQFYRVSIDESQIKRESRRFRAAIRLATRQLKSLASNKTAQAGHSGTQIFETHQEILNDTLLHEAIETEIAQERVNAEWAVKRVIDNYVAKYKAIPDEHLRERYIDLEDVGERLLGCLGISRANLQLEKDSIIAAKELKPSTLAELSESNPQGLITEHGGWTSHTFILAREVNLPAVTGLKKVLRRVRTGDTVIVDGYSGQVILHPEEKTLDRYNIAAAQFQEISYDEVETPHKPPRTLDGREIIIRANLDIPAAYRRAKRLGAQGVGLYRSEFLFNQFKGYPSEGEQIAAYRNIADFAGSDGVKIRTFDLSVEQHLDQTAAREKNPALGLRAVRLSLANPRQLRIQLRAILQSAYNRHVDIVLPMISGLAEILKIRELLARERRLLESRGVDIGYPRIGAMIEVPSAVLMIEQILEEADFLCLGTNDLVQYTLAADRDNESVGDWYRTLHPAVIRSIRLVLKAAEAAGKPAVVCGEMAGAPFYVPILVGLGAVELSMNINSILRVRKVISGIAHEETQNLIRQIEICKTADEIERVVQANIKKRWTHLYPPNLFQSRTI